MNNWLDELNAKQREAVETVHGPLLIVAGAGAGKTKTLTYRIGHLISSKEASGDEILAITFTNKAAREMRERILRLLGRTIPEGGVASAWSIQRGIPWVGTFHGLGVFLLREMGEAIGVPRHFHILDRDDALAAVKRAIRLEGVDPKICDPSHLLALISQAKSSEHPEETIPRLSQNRYLVETLRRVFRAYQHVLNESHALDFDDLLLRALELLRNTPESLRWVRKQWKFLHIDEYQDTNEIQYALVSMLIGDEKHVCVVGDSDQNIYSWRGATIANILRFEEDFPGAKVVLLEQNYRSTKHILSAANAVIAKNSMRKEKRLFTENPEGEPLTLIEAYDESDEARQVGDIIAELLGRGVLPSEIAILYRANFQSRVLEEALLYRGIPYQVVGTRFFERKEVKDLIAYLRTAMNPDSAIDITRSIATPPRGIGKITLEKLLAGGKDALLPAAQKKVREYFLILERIRAKLSSAKPSEIVRYALQESGLEKYYGESEGGGEERLANLMELVSLATRYDTHSGEEGIRALLSDAAIEGDQDQIDTRAGDAVRLMTVHAAKGLEFPYVFITGLEQDLFPSRRSQDESRNISEREEERRLFYVALTRAAKKVYLSYANFRTIFGNRMVNVPSEFLSDIPDTIIEIMDRRRGNLLDDDSTIYV
jgi:DNA helicase-2/ATP-dependent DNA helicase PcrA